MGLIYEQTMAIANKLTDGKASKNYSATIAGAVNAITDALAGEQVAGGGSIEEALGGLCEYASSGGSGIVLADWYCAFSNSTGDTLYYSVYYGGTYLLDGVYPEDEDLTFKAGETFVFYLQNETELTFTPDVGDAITVSGVYDESLNVYLYTFATDANMEPIEYFTITKKDEEPVS